MNASDDLRPYKGSIINEMYLHTADDNYIVARWSHDNGLFTDFFWNAVHGLEKYMKAVLLANDRSVAIFSHGLIPLYNEIEKLAPALLPANLLRPTNLNIYHWVNLTPREFLEKLDSNGNADNRYLTYGYVQHAWYIHMLDRMVWTIRRLAVPLDEPIIPKHQHASAPNYRDLLTKQPNYAHNLMLAFDRLVHGGNSEARRALLNNNCAFAPDDFQHDPRPSGSAVRNPVLLRRILEPLRSGNQDNARHGYRLGTWLLANTKQSKPVKDEISAAMAAALAAHPGINKP